MKRDILGEERVFRIRDALEAEGYLVHVQWDQGPRRPKGYTRDIFGAFDLIAVSDAETHFIQACGDEGFHMTKIRRMRRWPYPTGLFWDVWREQADGFWVFTLLDDSFRFVRRVARAGGNGSGQGVPSPLPRPVGTREAERRAPRPAEGGDSSGFSGGRRTP